MARKPHAAPARRTSSLPPKRKTRSPEALSSRPHLTRERVLASALALIDEGGLAGFSIRSLGAALGCEPMSIYHYFPSKAHLQDALVDDALAGALTAPPGAEHIDRLSRVAH